MPPVPAKRYDIFITAFEKEVHERQKQIEKMDKLMRPYEIIRAALERVQLKNDHSIRLEPSGVVVTIAPTDEDQWGAFDPLLADIGQHLKEAKLHSTGVWTVSHDYSIDWNFAWRLVVLEDTPTIRVRINVPYSGTKWIRVAERKTVETVTRYESTWYGKDSQIPDAEVVTDDTESEEVPFQATPRRRS